MQRPSSSAAPSLGKSLLHEMQMLLRSLQAPGRRRNPHLPAFHKTPTKRRLEGAPTRARRAHGIAKHVRLTPSAELSAEKNGRGYMHASVRARYDANVVALENWSLGRIDPRKAVKILGLEFAA